MQCVCARSPLNPLMKHSCKRSEVPCDQFKPYVNVTPLWVTIRLKALRDVELRPFLITSNLCLLISLYWTQMMKNAGVERALKHKLCSVYFHWVLFL